jgi:hypothetical protein
MGPSNNIPFFESHMQLTFGKRLFYLRRLPEAIRKGLISGAKKTLINSFHNFLIKNKIKSFLLTNISGNLYTELAIIFKTPKLADTGSIHSLNDIANLCQ